MSSPCVFDYSFYMLELTRHQRKRIRSANAIDLARIVDQELYWSPVALQEILKRIERLNQEDPVEAKACAEHALNLLPRIRDLSVDLKTLTMAVFGSTLRNCGELEEALSVYRNAVSIERLSPSGRGEVLARMAVAQLALEMIEESLASIDEALSLVSDPVPVLAVRAVVLADTGRLAEALNDSLRVLEESLARDRHDYSLLSAITVACFALSFETALEENAAIFHRLEEAIEACHQQLPSSGSGFYKVRRPRLMLLRAKALILMRTGRNGEAIVPLQRAVRGLLKDHPDDALAAVLDLVCAYAAVGEKARAASLVRTVPGLLDRVRFNFTPLARHALIATTRLQSLELARAVELRSLLRPVKRGAE